MPTVAEIIRQHHDAIVEQWAEEANRSASSRGLTRPELMNIMPRYVTSLGRTAGASGEAERIDFIERHIGARIREGFRLDEIIEEFAILGRCITGCWTSAPPPERPDAADVAQLFEELHRAATTVAAEFTQHMLDDAQTEKHYLRRLQVLAREVSTREPRGSPMKTRLHDVVELVREAIGAETAALLLYDVAERTLTTAAAVGVASEQLERYGIEQAPSSFVGAVVADEETSIEITDVATTELAVNDALREQGIHALLGVRLPARHSLQGVLYVGIAEQRSFHPREVQRLEALGEQLTLHLDNAQLFAALRGEIEEMEIERALRDRFVSVLAHDLRGPLTAARLNAQMLVADEPRLGDHGRLPERVVRGIDRVDRMVRDLLDALLIRAGRPLPLDLGECDLGEIARTVATDASTVHGANRVVVRGDESVRGCWSAEDLLRALENLVTNGIKYGAAGAPVVITLKQRPDGAEVAVHNEGAAIPPEDRALLFKPFSQLRSAADGRHGWGLGLTLVQGCVAAHGGRIDVTSEPGEGTTFTIWLPPDARPFQPSRAT